MCDPETASSTACPPETVGVGNDELPSRGPVPADLQRAVRELGERPERCLLCAGNEQRELFRRDGKVFWLCRSCELVYVHDIYPEFATRPSGARVRESLHPTAPRRRKKFDGWLDELAAHRRLNRLLEVGCGQGEFLQHAGQQGWEVKGVDVDPARVALARTERDLDVFAGELHEAALDSSSYDVVFMNEVIEHIVDPVALMKEVRRVLRPRGVAFLRTGNARSWSARWRGAAWDYYRFGYHAHIRYYSPRAAWGLARAAGFDAVDVRTRGFAFRESGELNGKWFKLLVKLAQGAFSPLVGPLGRGHRLRMIFHRGES